MKSINHKLILVILASTVGYSKSHILPGPPKLGYNLSLNQTSLSKEGVTLGLSIDWKGKESLFGLNKVAKGIAIDSKTGVISWAKTLPLGTTTIIVLAFNNADTV